MNIALIIGILGLIVAIIALKKDHYSRPKDEIEHLTIQFKATQMLLLQVEQDLEALVKRNNAYSREAWQGITIWRIP